MPQIQTDVGELFYTVGRGPTADSTLVLVHGAGGSRIHWPPEMRRIGEVTVYALDLPGHGRSGGDGCETTERYVDAVIAFLEAVGVDQAVVVGHSMGGAIAQTLALEHVSRVRALGLIATGARLRVAPAILETIQNDFERAVELITRYAWSADADPSWVELGRKALTDTGPEVLLGDFLACDQFDVMDRVGEIEVPVLVVSGTADELTPTKYARFLAQHIPAAQLVTLEGAGHMVMLERPQGVAKAIRGFVTALC